MTEPKTPTPLHPALTIESISSFVKETLTIEKSQYTTWAELFKILAKVFLVLDHIILSVDDKSENSSSVMKTKDPSLWSRIDAIVLQWIYSTISNDLLNTIIEVNSTAEKAWSRLEDIFSDNKNSHALYLEQEYSAVKMANFLDASSYCQHLKSLSDQLTNVGSPVSSDRLVLQMISGLTDAYDTVGTQIRHLDALPPFYKARSILVLEETARNKKMAVPSESAAISIASNPPGGSGFQPSSSTPRLSFNRSNNNHRGGRNDGRSYRGRNSRNNGRYSHRPSPQQPNFSSWAFPPWANFQQWAVPPCPYPSWPNSAASYVRRPPSSSSGPSAQPGLLGARPQQAHLAQQEHFPTDIAAAMHTMAIQPPPENYIIDSGATSHMTSDAGFSNGEDYYEM